MEIVLRFLYRPKRIWYLVLFYLCAVTMETGSISPGSISPGSISPGSIAPGDALYIPDHSLETASNSPGNILQLSNKKVPSNDNKNITHQNSSITENKLNNNTYEECYDFHNITFEGEDCQEIFYIPPPDFEDMPPPPLPPFLKEIELLFQASRDKPDLIFSYSEDEQGIVPLLEEGNNVPLLEEGKCPLCQWSRGNNETLVLFKREPNDKKWKKDSQSIMVWVLVGVALLSGSIGAVLMGLFLKCKKKDVINICSKTSPVPNSTSEDNSATTTDRTKTKLSLFLFPFRNWGGSHSRNSLDPYRAESIQNTYSESPYINTDSSSTLYAEINSPVGDGSVTEGVLMCSPDAYSEVPDPLIVSSGMHVVYNKMPKVSKLGGTTSNRESVYSNSAYIVSEASSEPNESSGGSTSTPSSAYYSDVSTSLEVHVNKKKKKKRKNDEKLFRLAPSQKLRNHYLPTFRPQQIHPLCSNDEQYLSKFQDHQLNIGDKYVPKFQEHPQNIYCSNNFVQGFIPRQNSNVTMSAFDPGPSFVQNSVGVPLQNTDGATTAKLSNVEGIPLCLHFGKICSEQGRICSTQLQNHSSVSEQGPIKGVYSDQCQINDKNAPSVQYQIKGNIYHSHDQITGNLYQGQCSIGENIHPGQCHISENIHPGQCQIGENIHPGQCQIDENIHPGQCHINDSVHPGHYQISENLHPGQCQSSGKFYFAQEKQKGKLYEQSHNNGNVHSEFNQISGHLYSDQGYLNEEICSAQNEIDRNIYPGQEQMCGNANYQDQDCENVYLTQDQIRKCGYYVQNQGNVFPGPNNLCGSLCVDQDTSANIYLVNGSKNLNSRRNNNIKNVCSGDGSICENNISERDLPCEIVHYEGQHDRIKSEHSSCDHISSDQTQFINTEQGQLNPHSDNIYSSQCGALEENYSSRSVEKDSQRSLSFPSCRIIQEPPQTITEDQVQGFSPTPSEYI